MKWHLLAIFSNSTGVDTDLWVITLWKELCFLLIANSTFFCCFFYNRYQICLSPLSICSDGGLLSLFFLRISVVLCLYKRVHTHVCFIYLFIYLFLPTEPTVGPRRVARKQCPMATAEAHASTRTFLWKKQDKPVQCKSELSMPACHYVTRCCITRFVVPCHHWINYHSITVTH